VTPENILERVGEQLGVRRVFGEPIEHDGVLVVPVAVAIGGGGGGSAPGEQGTGGGFGGVVRGIGVYEITGGRARFIPAIDATALAAMAVFLTGLVLRSKTHPR
jgi:uncharacterized spore protein YtfJ